MSQQEGRHPFPGMLMAQHEAKRENKDFNKEEKLTNSGFVGRVIQ